MGLYEEIRLVSPISFVDVIFLENLKLWCLCYISIG